MHDHYTPKVKPRYKHPVIVGMLIGMAFLVAPVLLTYWVVASQNTIKVSIIQNPTPTPTVAPPSISTGYVITGSYEPVTEKIPGTCSQEDISDGSFGCDGHQPGDLVDYTISATCIQGWHPVPHLSNGYSADYASPLSHKFDLPPVSVGYFLIRSDGQYWFDQEENYGHTTKELLFGDKTIIGYEVYAVPQELAGLQSFYQRYKIELGQELAGSLLCGGL